MRQKKQSIKQSISKLLEPLSEYLIGIETIILDEDKTHFVYKLGIPRNWVMKTNLMNVEFVGETNKLQLLKLSPVDYNQTKDDFFEYVINLIEKNKIIDKKRIELENKINQLKTKFTDEQDSLMRDLFQDLEEHKMVDENLNDDGGQK